MPRIGGYYECSTHTAEWDTLRQGFFCAVCNHRWSEHDVPALLAVIDELKQCSKIAEAARRLEVQKSLDGEKRIRELRGMIDELRQSLTTAEIARELELQKSLESQRKLAETLNRDECGSNADS